MTKIGTISWVDLTVPDADRLRDFYRDVAGWTPSNVDMGEYSDYAMLTASGDGVAGVCHARGTNADMPPQWMIYITVANLDQSIEACKNGGGTIVVGPKAMGSYGRYCVLRDPAGAVAGLIEPAEGNAS